MISKISKLFRHGLIYFLQMKAQIKIKVHHKNFIKIKIKMIKLVEELNKILK